ncbi:hypothetical protein SEUCBS140593_006623 [Sporothrix eucalyptigena]|uniref:Uncharacterized protein n=1 Tax=Sporothrix eucalyptigena TaxID=1812306 RepID=A0ABP0C7F3_9PEZI
MFPSAIRSLVLASLPLVVAAASDATVSTTMLTYFGPTALSAEVASSFLGCVNATGDSYGLYVEDTGGIIVVPLDQRRVDLTTTDAALLQCILASNDAMYLAAESTEVHSATDKGAVALDGVSYDWLVAQGTTGKQALGTKPASSPLTSRGADAVGVTQTYGAYLDSSGRDCTNHDHHTFEENSCHGVRQAYKSARFENTHGGTLHMEIWPHHDCDKNDSRTFVITGLQIGECQKKDVFSWKGHY